MLEALKKRLDKYFRPRAAYDAGAAGRRLGRWQPGMIGPNAAVVNDVEQIRARARDLASTGAHLRRRRRQVT